MKVRLFSFNRNRFAEQTEFILPLDENSEIVSFDFNPRAIAYMRRHRTTELPPQFPVKLTGTQYRRTRQYLQCYGFCLENEYPDNIALLSTGEVLYCVEFREPEIEYGPCTITALRFKEKNPMFCKPHDSSELGLLTVKVLEFKKYSFSSDLLVGKCFIFAHQHNLLPTRFNPLPEQLENILHSSSSEVFHDAGKAYEISEEGLSTISSNEWDVLSMQIPGRHTLE